MKKLMIVAMVALAAVAANAAKVKWGVNYGSVSKVTAGTMYLVWAPSALSFDKLAEMEAFNAASIATIGGTVVDSVTYAGSTAQTIVKPTTPISTMGSGPRTFYTMIIDTTGKEFAYSTSASVTILNNENSADISKIGTNFTTVDAKDPEPTPEPTSAILMALGLAGLALRRKQK